MPFVRVYHAPWLPHRPTGAPVPPAPRSTESSALGLRPAAPGAADDIGPGMVDLLPRLQRYALRRAGNVADAQDLVQETCRRALEAQARFAPGTDLGAWLFSILRNLHVDRCRRAGREVLGAAELEALPAAVCEPDPTWTDFSEEDVIRATASLPSPYRDTYELYIIDGLSYDEISSRLGIPERTVGTRLHRARLRLRRILASYAPSREAA